MQDQGVDYTLGGDAYVQYHAHLFADISALLVCTVSIR